MENTIAAARGTKNRFAYRKEMQKARNKRIMKKFIKRNLSRIILIGLPLIGIIAGVMIGVKATTYAQSNKLNDYGRHMAYTSYTVKSGDTLWSIASDLSALNPEFNDIRQYVVAIRDLNSMKTSNIMAGQTILIPYYVNPDGTVSHDEIYSKYGIGNQ